MSELAMHLRRTTEKMACSAKVDMSLWNEHSNACLDSANAVERLEAERDALRDLLAEAVQWLRMSDLPCEMTIHRIDALLNKGGGDD